MSTVVHISEAASLAFHSMGLLAKHPSEHLTTKRIARETGASHAHLSKVLQRLAKSGLVKSTPGPRGGFTLAKPADQITLLDVYEAIEGPIEMPSCYLGKKDCLLGSCLFNGFVSSTTAQFRDYLAGKRLTDLKRTQGE